MKRLKKLLIIISSFIITVSLLYLICYIIPAPVMIRSNEITIYDQNEKVIVQTHYGTVGKYVELDEISDDFIIAFIASEDESFYNHIGFSLKGIFRAIINNIKNGSTQGGSTITQQLSRSLYLDNKRSFLRKIKEALITIRLETHYDKAQIIEQYLNNIFLGHNIYGIEHASRYYFNKSNKQLTLDEICMIVGIANAPNINAPDINYLNAISRRNYVLKRLYQMKHINKNQYEKYLNKKTIITLDEFDNSHVALPYYHYINNLLHSLKLYNKKILAKGLKVYTTIDNDIQEKLYKTTQEYAPNDGSEISAVVMKANSGDVLAMVGSYDINDEYNRAILSQRPVGSTIKPLLYYLALKCGMKPTTFLSCNEMTFHINGYDDYAPTNASNKYAKHDINMIEAIGLSDNIYATKTLLYVGFENFERLLKLFNIDTTCVPSSALGVDEMSLLKITSIYNCFASLGIFYTPRIVTKIVDHNDKILYLNSTSARKVLDKPYVFLLNQLLRAPFDKNLVDYTSPTLLNYQTDNYFAAKTGSDSYNSYVIGYNPKYTIGVWTGTDNNEEFSYKNISKKVFQVMANSIADKNLWYNPPSYIDVKQINPITATKSSSGSIYWEFKEN